MKLMARLRRKLARLISRHTAIDSYFNVPFKFFDKDVYTVNERIVEVPFVLTELKADDKKLKILDFGCTDSWLPISLASLGHEVFGIDLRPFPFSHENLVFRQQNILDFEEKDFDVIIAVSSLEHVGLEAYGIAPVIPEENALEKIITKIHRLLAAGGKFILTVPVGQPFSDRFMRSFTPADIENLVGVQGFSLEKSRFFQRTGNKKHWLPCSREDILAVSNREDESIKGRCGANGVGCLVFKKLLI